MKFSNFTIFFIFMLYRFLSDFNNLKDKVKCKIAHLKDNFERFQNIANFMYFKMFTNL